MNNEGKKLLLVFALNPNLRINKFTKSVLGSQTRKDRQRISTMLTVRTVKFIVEKWKIQLPRMNFIHKFNSDGDFVLLSLERPGKRDSSSFLLLSWPFHLEDCEGILLTWMKKGKAPRHFFAHHVEFSEGKSLQRPRQTNNLKTFSSSFHWCLGKQKRAEHKIIVAWIDVRLKVERFYFTISIKLNICYAYGWRFEEHSTTHISDFHLFFCFTSPLRLFNFLRSLK